MKKRPRELFKEFTESEQASGIILLICTVFSLLATNTFFSSWYGHFWHYEIKGLSVTHWINDALMAVFFLLVGLELKREILFGELSTRQKAMHPVVAALGGMIVPALIYILINFHTGSIKGTGIPMATDIAFSLAILSLVGKNVPFPLKIFLTALAVADDLGAIIVIAIFYTQSVSIWYLIGVMAVAVILYMFNKYQVHHILPYLIGGIIMWFFMFKSGVHATLAGVLLAFLIPSDGKNGQKSLLQKLEHSLTKPVAFFILPLFALANTSIEISLDVFKGFINENTIGIALGLFLGKPLGIWGFSYLSLKLKLCQLPKGVKSKDIFGIGLLGGIGFTMSIFISILAFEKSIALDYSKMAVIIGSTMSGILGYFWLRARFANK